VRLFGGEEGDLPFHLLGVKEKRCPGQFADFLEHHPDLDIFKSEGDFINRPRWFQQEKGQEQTPQQAARGQTKAAQRFHSVGVFEHMVIDIDKIVLLFHTEALSAILASHGTVRSMREE
jgi:hypothetical protein